MASHQMQSNRFELKYVIDERRARLARDFVRAHLEPDPYAKPANNFSYYIHSLYLDTPDRQLCFATTAGHRNRVKLRIRFYDDNPDTPIFFEIKRRVNDVILKERAAAKKSCVLRLLNGWWPERSDLFKPDDDKGWRSLWRFMEMKDALNAQGAIFVSYLREAWVHPIDDTVRVTVDRDLTTSVFRNAPIGLTDFEKWRRPPLNGVVLELKFTDRFPHWMRELVQTLNLWRGPFAKYVTCTHNLRHAPPRTPDGLTYMGRFSS